jgi:UDP-N-acetylglucosamine 2-epimerase
VLRELDRRGVPYRLVETGQHGAYLPVLRGQLGIRQPDVRLGGDRDADTLPAAVRWALGLAGLLVSRRRLRSRVFGGRDGVCLVHGDTPSTLLATLMARRAGLPVAHLESGLRSGSFRHPFPEELIRVMVMRRAAVCFAPDASAADNLRSMELRARIVETSGNTGLEALRDAVAEVRPGSGPVVATMHRVENLHRSERFDGFLALLGRLADRGHQVTFVVHPPTDGVLSRSGGRSAVEAFGVATSDLVSYDEFVTMLAAAPFVITDGGSIQEECARLGVPTLLWRDRTERPDGVGENVLVSRYEDDLVDGFLADPESWRRPLRLGDERPAAEVVDVLVEMSGDA